MGTKPRTQERPKAFHSVDMDFVKAIAILITGIFSLTMINGVMVVAPLLQSDVDRVFIGVKRTAFDNDGGDNGLDRFLLDILKQVNDHLPTTLNETEHRRFLSFQRAAFPCAFSSAAAAFAALLFDDFGMAFVARHNIHFIGFHHTAQLDGLFFATIPSRRWVVIA